MGSNKDLIIILQARIVTQICWNCCLECWHLLWVLFLKQLFIFAWTPHREGGTNGKLFQPVVHSLNNQHGRAELGWNWEPEASSGSSSMQKPKILAHPLHLSLPINRELSGAQSICPGKLTGCQYLRLRESLLHYHSSPVDICLCLFHF